jgi:hypothetical protein
MLGSAKVALRESTRVWHCGRLSHRRRPSTPSAREADHNGRPSQVAQSANDRVIRPIRSRHPIAALFVAARSDRREESEQAGQSEKDHRWNVK